MWLLTQICAKWREAYEAEAKALMLQKQAVTPELVALRKIELGFEAVKKWDGKLPGVTGGAMPFIDIEKLNK